MPDLAALLGSTSEPVADVTTPSLPDLPPLDETSSPVTQQIDTLPSLPEGPDIAVQTPGLPDLGDLF
jgi:hypothetical protein